MILCGWHVDRLVAMTQKQGHSAKHLGLRDTTEEQKG
jgi:hypothetical protein